MRSHLFGVIHTTTKKKLTKCFIQFSCYIFLCVPQKIITKVYNFIDFFFYFNFSFFLFLCVYMLCTNDLVSNYKSLSGNKIEKDRTNIRKNLWIFKWKSRRRQVIISKIIRKYGLIYQRTQKKTPPTTP